MKSLLFAAGLSVGVWGLHEFQWRRLSTSLRERAAANMSAGKTALAAKQLTQYLALNRDDLDARLTLDAILRDQAKTKEGQLVKKSQLVRSIMFTERLLTDHPDLHDIRRQHVSLLLSSRRPSDARSHLNVLPERPDRHAERAAGPGQPQVTTEQRIAWYVLSALAHEMAGDAEYAVADYEQALNLAEPDPFPVLQFQDKPFSSDEAGQRHVSIYYKTLNQPDKAWDVSQAWIKKFPNSGNLRLVRAKLMIEDGLSPISIFNELDKALTETPEGNIQAVLLYVQQIAASENLEEERIENLIGYCRDIAGQGKGDRDLYVCWSSLEQLLGRKEASLQILRDGVAKLPESPELRLLLADALLVAGNVEEAEQIADGAGVSSQYKAYFQGRVAVFKGEWLEAQRLFLGIAPVPPELAYHRALHLSECADQLQQFDRQLSWSQEAARLNPTLIAQQGVARALVALERWSEAAAAYQNLPTSSDPIAAVQAQLMSTLSEPPAKRNWARFEAVWESAWATTPESHELPILKSHSLIARSRLEDAESVLKAATDQFPNELDLWRARIDLAIATGDTDDAKSVLDAARAACGSSLELSIVEIPLWKDDSDDEVLSKIEQLEKELWRRSPAEQARDFPKLAAVYQSRGKKAEALRLWRSVALSEAPTREALIVTFNAAWSLEDQETMQTILKRFRAMEGDQGINTAYVETLSRVSGSAADRRARQDALQRLGELSARRPDLRHLHLAKAALEESMGLRREAAQSYLDAIKQGALAPTVLRRTVGLLAAEGQQHRVHELTAILAQASTSTLSDRKDMTEAFLLAGETEKAAQLMEEIPADADWLWRAQMFAGAGRLEEAEAALEQATEQNPENDQAWLARVLFLLSRDRRSEAESVATEARTHLKSELALGALDQSLGDLTGAEQHFRAAYSRQPSFVSGMALSLFYQENGEAARSIPILEQLLTGAGELSVQERTELRRRLAVALAGRDYQGLREALALIDENQRESGSQVADLRLKAALLNRYPFTSHAAEIQKLSEDIEAIDALNAQDRAILASAYDLAGDSASALREWTALARQSDVTPSLLKRMIFRHLRFNRPDLVEAPLKKLQTEQGWDADRLTMACWQHCLQERPESAIALLEQIVTAPTGGLAERGEADRRELAAHVSKQLGEQFADTSHVASPLLAHAEKLYTQLLPDRPLVRLSLAILYAQQNRPDDAMEALDLAHGQVPEAERLRAAISVIGLTDLSEQDWSRINVWMSAYEPASDLEGLILQENFSRLRGDLRNAEALNRQILEIDPQNVAAFNNLAWLLATRGSTHDALELVAKAIEIAGPLSALLDTRAMALGAAGDWTDAIEDLTHALRQSDSPLTRLHLALACDTLNDPDARTHVSKLPQAPDAFRRTLPQNERKDLDRLLAKYRANP